MSPSYAKGPRGTNRSSLILAPFLQGPGLPLADVLSEEQVDAAMRAEGVGFGQSARAVYTPAITLWAFLSQVLHAGELRSCTAAVARVGVLWAALGRQPCSSDTGEYCRARAKLPEAVIRRLAVDVGHQLEARIPADWLWFGRHVKIADGTMLSMPDTSANQRAYPQSTAQKPGLGFSILRMVVLLSLATAALCGMAVAPFAGKETGETSLRCKSPEMVRKEIWAHWLTYNLVRKTIAQAALAKGKQPRHLSFAGARQTIAASWDWLSRTPHVLGVLADVQFTAIASHAVGNRPDRVEPRAIKRRPKPHRLLQKPRGEARAELLRSRGQRR